MFLKCLKIHHTYYLLGSPVELTSTDCSPNGTTPQECLEPEIPTPERLLSVGPEKVDIVSNV